MLKNFTINMQYCTAYHPETNEPFRVALSHEIAGGIWAGIFRPVDNEFSPSFAPIFNEQKKVTLDKHTGDVYTIEELPPEEQL